jgi:hypothetical protein
VITQSVERRARGWTIGILWSDSRRGLGILLFTTASTTDLGPTHPLIHWVLGVRTLTIKRPGRRAILPLPQYAFMAWCSVKAERQLYLLPFYTTTFTNLEVMKLDEN